MGSILYAIFHEQQYAKKTINDEWYAQAEWWILVELLVFFGQVLCSVFFLLGLQIKGEFGYNLDPNNERYTHDSLNYYEHDISWFSFIFVMWCIHLFILVTMGQEQTETIKLVFSGLSLALRSSHFYFLMPLFSEDRSFVEKSQKTWIILGVLQVVACCLIFGFKTMTAITTASGYVDVIVYIGQYILYLINVKDNEKK